MSERRLLSLGTNKFQKTINWIQKCWIRQLMCSVWEEHKHSWASIYKLWNHLVFVHLLSSFGGVIIENKIWAALRSTWFFFICVTVFWIISGVYSDGAFNTERAPSLLESILTTWFCQDMQTLQSLEVDQRFLIGLKVVLISVAAALSASWMRRMPNPTYCTSQDNPQKQDLWNFMLNEIFYLECQVEVALTCEVSLDTMQRRDVGCCP